MMRINTICIHFFALECGVGVAKISANLVYSLESEFKCCGSAVNLHLQLARQPTHTSKAAS
jgi:hypothetical protein